MNFEEVNDTIYGIHSVKEALQSENAIDKIFLKTGISNDVKTEILNLIGKKDIPVQYVPTEKLDRLCPRDANHQGVVAQLSLVGYVDPEDMVSNAFDKGEAPLIIMLDEISDVRNFGAIARSAECLGAHGIIIPNQGAAKINSDAIKISSGALHHLPIARVKNLVDAALLMQASGLRIVSCTEQASKTILECDFKEPTCIILGSEDVGISKKLLNLSDEKVKIPMKGNISSLNVSVATGVILMEAVRQRGA